LKLRAVNKRVDIGLEPRIGGAGVPNRYDFGAAGGVMATCPTRPASATMQKANASNRNRAADRMCERDACIRLTYALNFS